MSQSRSAARIARRVALVATSASAALLLAACSSGASTSGSGSSSSASSVANSAVAAKVAAAEKIGSSYPIPTGSISNVASLKGKTVYYIPITQQAPQFGVTATALKAALTSVGITLDVCNGNATPTAISACIDQAVKAKAGAIVTDSIPYVLAANSFAAAEQAGIPVLNTDQVADPSHPAADKLGYIYAAGTKLMVAVADWIIADSAGKASVVINEGSDSPASISYVTAAQTEFKNECPGCTVTINKVTSANFSLIAPSTSSALLKTPNVGYVVSEYDQYLQPTLGGVQQAGKTAAVKGASGGAGAAGLQMLASKNFLYAAAGQAAAYQGWADADAVLRMMTGTSGADLPTYTIPIRLFTRDTIGDVKTTAAAEASGEWFGPTTFTDSFKKLWGID